MPELSGSRARNAVARLAFDDFVRIGRRRGTIELFERLSADRFVKYNHEHDPSNGQFTFRSGGGSASSELTEVGRKPHRHSAPLSYLGATTSGIGPIKPLIGGHTDANGCYVPEVFTPDPLALHDPASAIAHYVGGSGTPRNYYFAALDTTTVTPVSFPAIKKLLLAGQPGLYKIVNAQTDYDSSLPAAASRLSAGSIIGRLPLETDGVLAMSREGRYTYDGILRPTLDHYDFNVGHGRTVLGELSTEAGALLSGKQFPIYIIGSKPLSALGSFVPRIRR